MIVDQIRQQLTSGSIISKPKARADFKVKGWGSRRGEPALIYLVPNHKTPEKPYQKGITITEFETAYQEMQSTGAITRSWFNRRLPKCAREGSCNFTTIGGVFEDLGIAIYTGKGRYEKATRDNGGNCDLPSQANQRQAT